MTVHQFPKRPRSPKPQRPVKEPPTKEPMFNIGEPAPIVLGVLLVLCHLVFVIAPHNFQVFMSEAFTLASSNGHVFFAERPLGSISTLLTHALLHAGWQHVITNAVMIGIFGVITIRSVKSSGSTIFGLRKGPAVFLAIFLIGAISGGLAQWGYWIVMKASGAAIGASSGGSALWACTAWIIGGRKYLLTFGVAMVAIDVLSITMGANPAWAAHLGGYLAGAVLASRWLIPESRSFGSFR